MNIEEKIKEILVQADKDVDEKLEDVYCSAKCDAMRDEHYSYVAKQIADLFPKGDEEGLLLPDELCKIYCDRTKIEAERKDCLSRRKCEGYQYIEMASQKQKALDDINKQKEIGEIRKYIRHLDSVKYENYIPLAGDNKNTHYRIKMAFTMGADAVKAYLDKTLKAKRGVK